MAPAPASSGEAGDAKAAGEGGAGADGKDEGKLMPGPLIPARSLQREPSGEAELRSSDRRRREQIADFARVHSLPFRTGAA